MAARTTTLPIMHRRDPAAAATTRCTLAEEMVVLDQHQRRSGELRRRHRLPAPRVRDVRRRLPPPGQDRRREARAPPAGQDGRAVRARGPAHPRHPGAAHARRPHGRVGRRQRRRRPSAPAATASASSARTTTPPSARPTSEAARDNGHEPGHVPAARRRTRSRPLFVADDLDAAWDELGPYLMHDVHAYAEWNEGNDDVGEHVVRRDRRGAAGRDTEPPHRHRRRGRRHGARRRAAAAAPAHRRPPPEIAWRYLNTVPTRSCPPSRADATSRRPRPTGPSRDSPAVSPTCPSSRGRAVRRPPTSGRDPRVSAPHRARLTGRLSQPLPSATAASCRPTPWSSWPT